MMTLLSFLPLILVSLLAIFGGILVYLWDSEDYVHPHKQRRKHRNIKHVHLRKNL
jgi:hypothetical protein